MLGSRFAVLMLFTRIFKYWVLGVIGMLWLMFVLNHRQVKSLQTVT